ncbi:MAG: carbamoyl-phosphate synthase large subunit [Firmicutes bacterium]|nr:carbamoyl-phosphate synthase large subunit [Bacillota bacterium]
MPKDSSLKKVLVIGSGPIVIGQAAEFDYAGSQACRALKEEGIESILVNSNPATIMTDYKVADRVYLEPLTAEFVGRIIAHERPQGLLATLGGQTGLNLALELEQNGVLAKYQVQLIGTPISAICQAEDRELFKEAMTAIGEEVASSCAVTSVAEALAFAHGAGFPLIVRPAFTLGGSGGGRVSNERELRAVVERGLKSSPIGQVLVEQSLEGWKEIEFEVVRDQGDNAIVVCSMENIDPVGIHTGDSLVVAPAQTLTSREYGLLAGAALRIIRHLKIVGGCNVQFALDPASERYMVIEVNPRVSRSSALASKASGYPIAQVTTKAALGLYLSEIINPLTGCTYASQEPVMDYVVVKIPRWPFDKFKAADHRLGTQMKATGEVMALDRTLEGALLKAFRSLELGWDYPLVPEVEKLADDELITSLQQELDSRLLLLFAAFRRGITISQLAKWTGIQPFFLEKIANIVAQEEELRLGLTPERLLAAKRLGFTDAAVSFFSGWSPAEIRNWREGLGCRPGYKMVDSAAGLTAQATPYCYSTYAGSDEVVTGSRPKVVVLGSGPIRIGQGIEFDYCSVQAAQAVRQAGWETILINNNPETVSTDFDVADRLYFEPLTTEDVTAIIEKEQPQGLLVQLGGQTAINLAFELGKQCPVFGTSLTGLAGAEDREIFDGILSQLGLQRPAGGTVTDLAAGIKLAKKLGFPVLVRPSFVLGGRGMEIVYDSVELENYLKEALAAAGGQTVLIDRYLPGIEFEVDAISDGTAVFIPGILQHVEQAGIHSGDSIAVYPAFSLPEEICQAAVAAVRALAHSLQVRGFINIQFVYYDGRLYVLEANPRASRTVPLMSKITGVPLVSLATKIMLGQDFADLGLVPGLLSPRDLFAVKAPVFSLGKLGKVDPRLGPEMKSTGEVLGIDKSLLAAMAKALMASGQALPREGTVLMAVADREKERAASLARRLVELGLDIAATFGTADYFQDQQVPARRINAWEAGDEIVAGRIRAAVIIPSAHSGAKTAGFTLRRQAVEYGLPCYTSLDTLAAAIGAAKALLGSEQLNCAELRWYLGLE